MNYGKIANSYDDRYASEMCKAENAAVKAQIIPWAYGKKILDVGCGTGFALDLCPEISEENYYGIDISEEMVAVARKKHPGYRFVKKRAERLRKRSQYDAAFCLFSVPYIGVNAVEPIYNALKPGGIVVCVCYKKPYLNPASVYGGKKWKYRLTVAWKVWRVLAEFNRCFEKVKEGDLTDNDAYKVVIYKKG